MKFNLFLIFFVLVCFSACNDSIMEDAELPSYTITYKKINHTINSNEDIRNLIFAIYENKQIEIEQAMISEFHDEIGTFLGLKADIKDEKKQSISFFAPLVSSQTKHNDGASYVLGCTMTCTPNSNCDKCNQTIYERCKRQSCSCSKNEPGSGAGACSASITFSD